MNGWYRNGRYDAAGSYINYKLSGGGKYTGHRRKTRDVSGCGVLIYIFFMIIMMVAMPIVGLVMLGVLIWFWTCSGLYGIGKK